MKLYILEVRLLVALSLWAEGMTLFMFVNSVRDYRKTHKGLDLFNCYMYATQLVAIIGGAYLTYRYALGH